VLWGARDRRLFSWLPWFGAQRPRVKESWDAGLFSTAMTLYPKAVHSKPTLTIK